MWHKGALLRELCRHAGLPVYYLKFEHEVNVFNVFNVNVNVRLHEPLMNVENVYAYVEDTLVSFSTT